MDQLKASLVVCPETKPTAAELAALTNTVNHTMVSNLNADQQYIFGNTTELDYYVNQLNTLQGVNISKCPVETPWILKGETECSACPEETPIFDVSQEICVGCPEELVYNN